MKRISSLFLVAILSGAVTLGAYKLVFDQESNNSTLSIAPTETNYTKNVNLGADNVDFTKAAEEAVHSVVHVKNVSYSRARPNSMMEYIYGYRGGQQRAQVGTGSGVIITEDGYIVTNNHVIQNASELEITLNNNKSYKARLVGTDSKMDIALLKVDTDENINFFYLYHVST